MSLDDFEIRIVDQWREDEIVALYKAGGWWNDQDDSSRIQPLIKGSFIFAVVIEKSTEKAIGMGRVLSDGTADAYIQDLVILPDFRSSGIGEFLMKFLLEYCIRQGITWIGVIAEPGRESFYKKLGLKRMKNYSPMLYRKDE